jgi:hypothetical protein
VLAGRPDLMAKVIICSTVEVDYTESLTRYAAGSVDAANDFDAEFDRALTQIAADPARFPRRKYAYGRESHMRCHERT